MEKIDVAINSYKKPESLIYTLFSLKKACGDLIDTIYINDDCSGGKAFEMYTDPKLAQALSPIKIKARVNKKWSSYGKTLYTKRMFVNLLKTGNIRNILRAIRRHLLFRDENDIRYQWAINSTDKKYLFICHDDIQFLDNIIKKYLESMDEQTAIVGEMGQCWHCGYSEVCSAEKIHQGEYPSPYWPLTPDIEDKFKMPKHYQRDCRINEWCCMLNVDIARQMSKKHCYFGNYEDGGDVAAYYFGEVIKVKYKVIDPLPSDSMRHEFYLHGWLGISGHSVWQDQGSGKKSYPQEMIEKQLKEKFDYSL